MKRLVIDLGYGDYNSRAVGKNKLNESEDMLKIDKYLEIMLRDANLQVKLQVYR